jgi:3-hydroxyacyl-CoA dehydrogenase
MFAGFGFPRWHCGPMHHAGTRGLMVLRRDLRSYAADDPALWAPQPLIDRLIAEGRRLSDLDAA